MVEEFMHLWIHISDIRLEFTQTNLSGSRRIGTRGVDKGAKEDMKQIMKQQVLRENEDIDLLIIQFLKQEHLTIIQNYFEK
jgi:integrator complex subunit 10